MMGPSHILKSDGEREGFRTNLLNYRGSGGFGHNCVITICPISPNLYEKFPQFANILVLSLLLSEGLTYFPP